MKRWTLVVIVLALFLGAMAAQAMADFTLYNWSKSDNVTQTDNQLGLTQWNDCDKVIRKLKEEGFKEQKTTKAFATTSSGCCPAIFDAVSYVFIGAGKGTVLIDCIES